MRFPTAAAFGSLCIGISWPRWDSSSVVVGWEYFVSLSQPHLHVVFCVCVPGLGCLVGILQLLGQKRTHLFSSGEPPQRAVHIETLPVPSLPNRSSNTPSSKVCQTPLRASVYMVKNVGLFQNCSPTLLTLHIDVSVVERSDPLTIWLHRPPPAGECRGSIQKVIQPA